METVLGGNVGTKVESGGQVHCRMRVSVLSVATVWVDVRTCVRARVSECPCASERPCLVCAREHVHGVCLHADRVTVVCVCRVRVFAPSRASGSAGLQVADLRITEVVAPPASRGFKDARTHRSLALRPRAGVEWVGGDSGPRSAPILRDGGRGHQVPQEGRSERVEPAPGTCVFALPRPPGWTCS